MANGVVQVLDPDQKAPLLQVRKHLLAAVHAVQPLVPAGFRRHAPVRADHLDLGQPMAPADLEVIRVVRRGDLQRPGAERGIDVGVGDDRNFTLHERQEHRFPDEVQVAVVFRVHRHRGVPQHGLGPGGGDHHRPRAVFERVLQVVQVSRNLQVLHFDIGDGSAAPRAPVHNVVIAINQAFLVQPQENLPHGRRAALVHGEALPRPVTGRAEAAELGGDPVAVIRLPLPDPLQKLLPPEVVLGQALLGQLPFHPGLGGNPGVVGPGQPQRFEPLHPAPTGQNVLQRIVQGVTHVQLTGDVRGRHHDGIRLAARTRKRPEKPVFFPVPVAPLFNLMWIVY